MIFKAYSSIPERLHIVITGERGRPFSLVIERDRAAAVFGGLLALLVLLTAGTWLGAQFFQERNALEDYRAETTRMQADAACFRVLPGKFAFMSIVVSRPSGAFRRSRISDRPGRADFDVRIEELLRCDAALGCID